MSLFLFAFTALSVIYSVDFGSDNVKLGIALPGRIEVALNMQSKRYTPSYFALYNLSNKAKTVFPNHWEENQTRELEWMFAYDAQTQGKRFPQNAIRGMPKLLENSKGLTGREMYAIILKHLISTASDGKFKFENSKLMIAVEPWLSRKERFAIKEAINIGGSNIAGAIDSPTSAATTYALERQSMYYNSSRTVAFLDIGHNHTWVSIYNFSSNGTSLAAEQLSLASNATLGGYIIDETIADIFMKNFAKQYNHKLPLRDRVVMRFLDEARRSKERLTVSESTTANIEDVIDEECFTFKLTREYFDSLFNSTTESLDRLLDEALNSANLTKSQLDSIELLGGTSRIPFINESIRSWSGMEKLNRTMNSDEAIAVGAGYAGAATSAAFIIQKINMSSFCGVNVSYKINGEKFSLFTERTPLKHHEFVNFTTKDFPMNITISIDNEGDFFTYSLQLPEETNETKDVTLEFAFDDITLPILYDARCNGTRLNGTIYKANWMLTNNQTSDSINFIESMDNVRYKRIDKLKLINDHEALTYKIRDRLEYDEEFLSVITEEEKLNITHAIEEHQGWANNETERKTRKIIRERLTRLERLTEDADNRLRERKERPLAFTKLNNTINETKFAIEDLPISKPWITEENITSLNETLNETEFWFAENYKIVSEENMTQNPTISYHDIDMKRWKLEDKLDLIRNIPKPKPIINETNSTSSFINGTSFNETTINGTIPNISSTDPIINETTIPNVNATIPEYNTTEGSTIPEKEEGNASSNTDENKPNDEL